MTGKRVTARRRERIDDKNTATAGNSAIIEAYNRVASATLVPSRGQTPKGLASMPPHDMRIPCNPSGLCMCGCGMPAPIAPFTDHRKGHIRGLPQKFVAGHRLAPPASTISIINDVGRIALTSTQFPGMEAVIDVEDIPLVNSYRWYATKGYNTFYARGRIPRGERRGLVLLHRLILHENEGTTKVDHADHDGLNNRRSNIRKATGQQNAQNKRRRCNGSSQYKGVIYRSDGGKWAAQISPDGSVIRLGRFDTEEAAARAYDDAASSLYGEFACLNFPYWQDATGPGYDPDAARDDAIAERDAWDDTPRVYVPSDVDTEPW